MLQSGELGETASERPTAASGLDREKLPGVPRRGPGRGQTVPGAERGEAQGFHSSVSRTSRPRR